MLNIKLFDKFAPEPFKLRYIPRILRYGEWDWGRDDRPAEQRFNGLFNYGLVYYDGYHLHFGIKRYWIGCTFY